MTFEELLKLSQHTRESLVVGPGRPRAVASSGRLWPLTFLAAQVFRNHEALELLARKGFGREAGMLLRAMFEATVNAVWISKELEPRLERYIDYQYVSTDRWRKVGRRWQTTKDKSEDEKETSNRESEEVRHRANQAARKHGFKRNQYWSGTTLKAMAKDIGWLERYELVYGIYSEVLHSGVASARDYVHQLPDGGILTAIGPQYDQAEGCLREGFMYLVTTFEVADIFLNLGLEKPLKQAQAIMHQVLTG